MANVQVQVDFVRNKRGGQSLVLGGYRYVVSTLISKFISTLTITWSCVVYISIHKYKIHTHSRRSTC